MQQGGDWLKTFNCETFLYESGTIRFPKFRNSKSSLDIQHAISVLKEQLSGENRLLKLQKEILNDQLFLDTLASYSDLPAEEQISKTNLYFVQAFSKLESDYFQERLKDISDICNMLKKIVLNISVEYPSEPCILYVEEITPYEILHLPDNIRGIVIKNNSKQTHTSILLKEQGIPFVNDVDLSDFIYKYCVFFNNHLYVTPTTQILNEYTQYKENIKENTTSLKLINLSSLNFPKYPFDGIGLFRTEMRAIQLGYIPSEEEQYQYYKKLDIGKPVRIRLFDFGEDKKIDNNPERGFQYLKTHSSVLKEQLKSILRCNCENFGILIPMVISVEDVLFIKNMVNELCENFGYLKIKVGCMIETPSSVFGLEDIIKEVDFINIGTNDLTKYTFATSRENPQYNKEIFQNIIHYIINIANKHNVPYYVCGEIGLENNIKN